MNNFVSGLLFMILAAVPFAELNAAATSIILHATPREYLGRVISILNPVQSLAGLISVSLSGWLASTLLLHFHQTIFKMTFGPIDTIFGAGAIMIIISGIYSRFSLRHLHLGEKATQADEKMAEAKVEEAETA